MQLRWDLAATMPPFGPPLSAVAGTAAPVARQRPLRQTQHQRGIYSELGTILGMALWIALTGRAHRPGPALEQNQSAPATGSHGINGHLTSAAQHTGGRASRRR